MDAVTLVAYLIAIAIPAFTIYLFIMLDVFGTGKTSTILLCVGWGALGAFGLAWTFNNFILDQGLGYNTLTRIGAPIIEEVLKSLILIYLVRQPRFRYIVDGAVYGIAVGIGFGLSENMLIYLPRSGEAVLGAAISRTLSTALMHAAASGLVGISLGRLRRITSQQKFVLPIIGIILAIALHVVYNNVVGELSGVMLLLVAIGIGVGGGVLIAWQINQGLQDEKARFAETLGLNVDVSTGERRAVQRLGGAAIEDIFGELGDTLGDSNISLVRRLLVTQANIGILQNNLSTPVSERLRTAWEEEIAELRAESEKIRKELGPRVNLFLQSVFPPGDTPMQQAFNEEMARFDPTLVHTFDMFMRSADLAETFTPDQLEAMAERLHQIEIFQNVTLANLENLCRAVEVQNFEGEHTLFNQGDQGDAMYLVEEGQVAIFSQDRETPLRTFESGAVVGEFALLDGQPRSARAQVQGTATLLRLQRQVFMMFIQSRPQVVLAMLQYLAEKARYTTLAVETSIAWMSRIEQGTYQTASPQPVVSETVPTPANKVATLELEELSAETVAMVSNVFSQAAATLQEREESLRAERKAS